MEFNKKSEDFLHIEKCFKEIKEKNNVQANLSTISRVLKRSFDLNMNISIVENDTGKFFGMNIYPSNVTIKSIISKILDEKPHLDTIIELWQKNYTWYMEIDSLLLYDKNLNANPAEITAVMLHEIGHIVYSNTIPQRVNKIMRYNIMNLDYSVKKLISNYKVRKLFNLVVIEACSSKNYRYINTNVERIADKFVVKMGYGNELDNFITKLITTHGNSLVNRTDAEVEGDIKAIVNWSVDNISELEFRKKKLKTAIQTELIKNPSYFVREIFKSIKTSFFGNDEQDKYKAIVSEQYLVDECKKVVQESILDFFDNIGKIKKVNQSDLDIISIEIDKIDNNDDKIYVLDLIYDKLDLINAALAHLEKGKTDKVSQSKQTLLNLKKELETMRAKVVAMQIKDKQYGVFIKYPKGYEG